MLGFHHAQERQHPSALEQQRGSKLFLLIRNGNWAAAFKLLDQFPELAKMQEFLPPQGYSNLIVDYVLFQNRVDLLKRLRDYPGAYVQPSSNTVAYLISKKYWVAIVELIEFGWLSANFITPYQNTYRSILDWAEQDRDHVNTKILIEKYKARTYKSLMDESALFAAVEYEDWQNVFSLLGNKSLSVNMRRSDPLGWTLLNYAFFQNNADVFLLLINEYKADLEVAMSAADRPNDIKLFYLRALERQKQERVIVVPVFERKVDLQLRAMIEKFDATYFDDENSNLEPGLSTSRSVVDSLNSTPKELIFSSAFKRVDENKEPARSEEIKGIKALHLDYPQDYPVDYPVEEIKGIKALHLDYPPPEGGDPIVALEPRRKAFDY